MENYYGSIDLLKLMGAKLCQIEVNGKPMNVVAIPVGWNDIRVSTDKQNKMHARLGLNQWGVNENYRKKCLENHSTQDGYEAPSHELCVNYSEDFMKAACKAAAANLRKNPEFMKQNPTDEQVEKQASYNVRNCQRLGTMTPSRKKVAEPVNVPSAEGYGAYKAPDPAQPVAPEDDLPF